ncbi:MAG: hypothetical protein R3C26_04730 [Calditrichia bacterium]
MLKLKSLVRIEPFRAASEREERLNELYFRLDQWGGDEGANQALVDSWIERALEPSNINEMRYDELLNLQSVSPVDAAAIVNYRNTIGRINSQRDLRSAPYLSYYGYRNASNFVSFGSVESKSFSRQLDGADDQRAVYDRRSGNQHQHAGCRTDGRGFRQHYQQSISGCLFS